MVNRQTDRTAPARLEGARGAPKIDPECTLGKIEASALHTMALRRGESEEVARGRAAFLELFRRKGLPGGQDEEWRGTVLRGRGILELPADLDANGIGVRRVTLDGPLPPGSPAGGRSPLVPLVDVLRDTGCRGSSWLFHQFHDWAGVVAREADAPALDNLNRAFMSDGAVLRVARGIRFDEPFSSVFRPRAGDGAFFPRTLIHLEEDGAATFVEEYHSPAAGGPDFADCVTEVVVGPGATLDLLSVVRWDDRVLACHRIVVRVAEGGRFNWYGATLGGALARVDVEIRLEGPGAASRITGIGLASGDRRIDHRTVQHHVSGDTVSRIDFGTLCFDQSSSVYRGMIRMDQGAQRSDAYQRNDNLLMAAGAGAGAIPKLEILADDVTCSHGSTVGNLADADLFYLTSRGIPVDAARNLAAEGFVRRVLSGGGGWTPLAGRLHDELVDEFDRRIAADTGRRDRETTGTRH